MYIHCYAFVYAKMRSNGLCGTLPPQIDFIFHLPEALLGPIKLPCKFCVFLSSLLMAILILRALYIYAIYYKLITRLSL